MLPLGGIASAAPTPFRPFVPVSRAYYLPAHLADLLQFFLLFHLLLLVSGQKSARIWPTVLTSIANRWP